MLIRKYISSKG